MSKVNSKSPADHPCTCLSQLFDWLSLRHIILTNLRNIIEMHQKRRNSAFGINFSHLIIAPNQNTRAPHWIYPIASFKVLPKKVAAQFSKFWLDLILRPKKVLGFHSIQPESPIYIYKSRYDWNNQNIYMMVQHGIYTYGCRLHVPGFLLVVEGGVGG